MKVLVLGGTGWAGHSIALVFHEAGHEVTICARGLKTTFLSEIPGTLPVVKADKRDEESMRQVLGEGYDVIIDSVPTPDTISLVSRYARGLSHYIHCSSTGGYAPIPFVPGDETMPYDHFMVAGRRRLLWTTW